MTKTTISVAVAGNPNAGKTSVFNALTGMKQNVGNYPGVTVEKKTGTAEGSNGTQLHFIDLPGTYSLTAYSQEEVVARNFILQDKPDVLLNIVDATNLERNLYLTVQLIEMQIPVVVALNMHDIAVQRGLHIDCDILGRFLGVPVIPTVATKNEGLLPLIKAIESHRHNTSALDFINYGTALTPHIDQLQTALTEEGQSNARYLSVKLLESDGHEQEELLRGSSQASTHTQFVTDATQIIEKDAGVSASTLIAEARYGFVAGLMKEAVKEGSTKTTYTDAIDKIVCNRILGTGFVALCIYAIFYLTFQLSDGWEFIPWSGEDGFTWTTPVGVFAWIFEELLPSFAPKGDGAFASFINDGVIAGVGGLMGFVPIIFFLFLLLGLIESSGYIARIAFVLDRILKTFGLQGKSIMPLIISGGIAGGCAVPGVMATRTLREEKDRITTMLVAPFMNCGAKIPVFILLIAAFFPQDQTLMMGIVTIISWSFAMLAALVLRKCVVKGEQTPFVMELPPYHVPRITSIFRYAFQKSGSYMKKAFGLVLVVNIVLWALMYFPRLDTDAYPDASEEELAGLQIQESIAGNIGSSLEPVSQLAGFDWRDNIALLGGFAAKEVIVSAMSTAYSMGEADPGDIEEQTTKQPLSQKLANDPNWNPLRAFAMILFVMLYAPCFVTIAVIKKESGSWGWAGFSIAYTTTLASIVSVLVYQIGLAFGLGL